MSLIQTIEQDLTVAQKQKEALRVSTLRLLKTALKNAEIAARPKTLTDEESIKVLRSEIKKRHDSIQAYIQGSRPDLADKEKAEIVIIKKYLPAELDEAAVKTVILEIIEKTGAAGPKDFGKVMGLAMKQLGAAASGTTVSKIIKAQLSL